MFGEDVGSLPTFGSIMNKEKAQAYLDKTIENLGSYVLTETDRKQTDRDLVNFIVRKIDRKKFRRKLTDATKEKIRQKINDSIKKQKPLHFVIPFGGYKHYWNASHPEPDWAEFFHFVWMTEYLAAILAAYKPGATIEYVSEDLILNRMNNYPSEVLETYANKFNELINWFNTKVPENLELRYFRIGDRYDKDKIVKQVEALLSGRREAFAKLSQTEQDKELHRSMRSVMWNGDKDLTGLTDKEKQQRIIDSRLIELAYYEIEGKPEFLSDYLWADNHICICFSFGLSHDNAFEDLTLSSAEGSIVDFWIGRGVLESRENRLNPRIVSRKQYEAFDPKPDNVQVSLNGINLKNLQSVEMLT